MHVLLLDDDGDMLKIMQRMLEHRGHTVTVLPSPFGATNHVAGRGNTRRPDAVVVDLMMPGLGGDALLSMWALDPAAREVPVILYSAADEETLKAVAQKHPRCTPLQKGVGMRTLLDMLENLNAQTGAGRAP